MARPFKSFAASIRKEIRAREWSGYRLAREAGIDDKTARRFLAGKHTPTFETMEKIIASMGWTIGPAAEGKRS